mmetsp:Transcript_22813/g.33808  ORF Transcript_22813/g.33808 Transcript_22813/m.33808 type:complete len:436 (-) Transcript_22813:172-1479(-)
MTHSGKILYTLSRQDDDVDLQSSKITIEDLQLDLYAAITDKASKSVLETLKTQIQELKSKAENQEADGCVDHAEAKRRLSSFQEQERRQSEIRIVELETREQASQKELRESKEYSDALRDFSKSEEMELHRLWTEVSGARKRIAKLEEENKSLDDKLQSVEEDRKKGKDQCAELELELIQAKEGHFATKEIILSDENASNCPLKSQLILAQERTTKLATEKDIASLRIIDLESDLTSATDRINALESDIFALNDKYEVAQVELILLKHPQVAPATKHNECEPATDLMSSKRRLSLFQSERKQSITQMEQFQGDDYLGMQQSEDSSILTQEIDVLKDITDTEGSELSRLWTEVSEARKQIAKLQEENAAINAKANTFEEMEQNAKDQYEELELELLQSQNKVITMKEAFGVFGNGVNKQPQIFSKRRSASMGGDYL